MINYVFQSRADWLSW